MGSFYNIKTKYENAIYERGEDNYYVVKIKNVDGSAFVDPSSVSITIYNPCSQVTITAAEMTRLSAGVYLYAYELPDDALYGKYTIEVTASSPTYTAKYSDKFFVLPWNCVYDVRRFSGITANKSISDHDIAGIIWEAYKEILPQVYLFVADETPKCNPDNGLYFNGTNTVFATRNSPIADYNGDGLVNGYGEASCGTDVDGYWKDTNGDCHRVNVTINDARCGNITITQTDGTAIPSNMKWVHINYYIEWRTFDINILKYAVAYLAAYKCINRFKELSKATMGDLHSNEARIRESQTKKMKEEYTKSLKLIRKPTMGAGMLPGE